MAVPAPPNPSSPASHPALPAQSSSPARDEAEGRLTAREWKTGLAAWLGWTFDGLDMHLYTLVAAPFVAELMGNLPTTHPAVGRHASIIQAAFLLGWALGGSLFGYVGDRLGRTRALSLTILTYALFTGLSCLAQSWWHLLILRFLAALGIGGEWAVGASLLAETWPRRLRPWVAAVLQTGVNIGVLGAGLANQLLAAAPPRYLFLVGVLPAFLVLWIRRAVPEPEVWRAARANTREAQPGVRELFRGATRRVTIWVMLACGVSLTAHWAFMFWFLQHLRNLPEVLAMPADERNRLASLALYLVIAASIAGCFFFGWIARYAGYRATIAWTFLAYFAAMLAAFGTPRGHQALMAWFPAIGFCQGVFALFTMYLPPLFPTLLRTTGAGFCYNIGRIAAAGGTVFFGLYSDVGDHRRALVYAGYLFVPAAAVSFLMPHAKD